MFVPVVELMEIPERISSSIRPEGIDLCYGVFPHALYFSAPIMFVFLGGLEDWKSGAGGGFISSHPDQPTGKMVQCALQILESISGDGCDLKRNTLDACNLVGVISGMRVYLY